jgi:hypothetical protein
MPPAHRAELERELDAGLDLLAESERTMGDDPFVAEEALESVADLPVKSKLSDAKTEPSPTT